MLYEHPPHAPVQPKNNSLLYVLLAIITVIIVIPLLWYHSKAEQAVVSSELTLPSPKIINQITSEAPEVDWHSITVKAGTNLSKIFQEQGLSDKTLQAVLALGKLTDPLKRLRPGEKIRLLITPEHQLQRLVYQYSNTEALSIHLDEDNYNADIETLPEEKHYNFASGTIKQSLFVAGQKAGLPQKLLLELTELFNWDIDFAKDIREGDSFTVLYEEIYVNGNKVRNGDIIAAEFINQGTPYQAIRFTDDKGHTDYYTADGESVRKAFLRTPVKYSRISSQFNPRRSHPILNTIRAHKGVDYAAPTGTPIKTTSDGKIGFIGKKGGYGNAIIVQHNSKYSTLYGHMSKFARGLKTGSSVQQGQIIGYVGSTGLASGPHLHYEFRINGKQVNPIKVKLPQAKPIAKNLKTSFQAKARQLMDQLSALHA